MWKRFNVYEGIIAINFLCNLFFYAFNEAVLKYAFPRDIAGYMFWISLGLYLGFQLCKYEMRRVWKKQTEKQEKID